MKTMKFSNPLPEMILEGKKNVSWRIGDEKDITVGDIVSLLRKPELKEFAKARIIEVKETTFGNISEKDKKGHEEFSSDEEMYRTYSKYYKMKVTPDTTLKIIRFKIIQK